MPLRSESWVIRQGKTTFEIVAAEVAGSLCYVGLSNGTPLVAGATKGVTLSRLIQSVRPDLSRPPTATLH